MRRNGLRAMQNDQIDKGGLKISVVSSNRNRPIANARIEITYTGDPERIVERLITDENGQIPEIELSAPPIEYSMTPSEYQPYSEYDFRITADEFEPITISGAEILPEITALQTIKLNERSIREPFEVITIPDHTLYGNYPPKIPEDEIKPVDESGEIVLSRVVIPEFIVVHDGSPEDSTQNIPASASFFAETFFMRENSFPVGRLQTAAPANHALPAKKAKRFFGLRSRLAGLLSRRNTASHRCRLQGSGRSPSARCACAQSRPLQGGNDSSSKNADKTKTGDTRRGASCKKSYNNDFLRRHYPHQVKGSKVGSFLSACITSSPVFGS